jgi:hypothetical protein
MVLDDARVVPAGSGNLFGPDLSRGDLQDKLFQRCNPMSIPPSHENSSHDDTSELQNTHCHSCHDPVQKPVDSLVHPVELTISGSR